MVGDYLRGYYTRINGKLVWVRVYAAPATNISLTKPKRQRKRGTEAGGRHIAKEKEA